MNKLYEALEVCLQDIERGTDVETALLRFPDFADELRPILEASIDAGNIAISPPSTVVVQRNRTKVLQHAAQMRAARARSSQRIWFASVRRLVVTLAVVAILFVSGTGLVRAASTTLPGDNLYPVKRTWENMLVAFAFNAQQRDALEVEHENERLQELHALFAEGRSEDVDFNGLVMSQKETVWVVSNISVTVSPQTVLPGQAIDIGSAVRVQGKTQGNNIVLAERIELLPAGAQLPDVGDEPEAQQENHEGPNQQIEDSSGRGSEDETPQPGATQTPGSESEHQGESVTEESSHTGSDSSTPESSHDSGSSGSETGSTPDGNHDSGGGGSDTSSGGEDH
jgi:uncharacterized membrane protein YgcG